MPFIQKKFYDLCYEILLRASGVPGILSTLKDIQDGYSYKNNFPRTEIDFLLMRNEIIAYIKKARLNNVIDDFISGNGSLALSRISNGMALENAIPYALYETLDVEIKRLILKGMYQLIKSKLSLLSDKEIIEKLYLNDIAVLQKYGLL